MPIRDQRNIYSTTMVMDTPTDVRRYWEIVASDPRRQGFTRDGVRGIRQLAETGETKPAWIEHGRWITICECEAAAFCWPAHAQTACLACGRVYNVTFPNPEETKEVLAVLEARPEPAQNWKPHEGETVLDLKVENVGRGFALKGQRKLAVDVAEVHGIEVKHAERLLREMKKSGDFVLLPEDV